MCECVCARVKCVMDTIVPNPANNSTVCVIPTIYTFATGYFLSDEAHYYLFVIRIVVITGSAVGVYMFHMQAHQYYGELRINLISSAISIRTTRPNSDNIDCIYSLLKTNPYAFDHFRHHHCQKHQQQALHSYRNKSYNLIPTVRDRSMRMREEPRKRERERK